MSHSAPGQSEESSSQVILPTLGSEVAEEVKRLLDQASQPTQTRVCPRCGDEMQYLDTIFVLCGTELSWNVKLPVCLCEPKFQA